jgi:hypothetical protein
MFSAAYCKAHGQNEHKMHWEKFMLFKMVSTQQIHFCDFGVSVKIKLFQTKTLNYSVKFKNNFILLSNIFSREKVLLDSKLVQTHTENKVKA